MVKLFLIIVIYISVITNQEWPLSYFMGDITGSFSMDGIYFHQYEMLSF